MHRHSAVAALALAAATTLAPHADASAIVHGPHIVDQSLARAASSAAAVALNTHGQPRATDRDIADTIKRAKPALHTAADDYRGRRGMAPLSHASALDDHAQHRADQLAAQSRALAVPTAPVWESVVFVPDDPARTVPAKWDTSAWPSYALVAPRAEVGGIGISYGYLPLHGWGYIVVVHTAPAGTDF